MLLRVDEVATRLRVQPATVYRLVRDGLLPAVRVARLVRVREADLDAFVRATRKVRHSGGRRA